MKNAGFCKAINGVQAPRAGSASGVLARGALVLALGLGFALPVLPPTAALAQNMFAPRLYVNGEVITDFEVQQRAMFMQLLNAPGDPEAEALKALTNERLQMALAKTVGLKPTEEEIRAGMEDFAGRANLNADQLLAELQKIGIAPETYRDFITAGVTWRQIVRGKFVSQVAVSDLEIDRALAATTQSRALKVQVSELVIPAPPGEEQAALALARRLSTSIDSEAEFAAAAREYSAAPTAANGGRVPDWLQLSNLPASIAGQIVALAPGRASAPVVVPNAVVLFQLRGIAKDDAAPPIAVTVEWAEYFLPDDAAELARVRANADECNDLYGLAKGSDPALLTIRKGPVSGLPQDVALALAPLDAGESISSRTAAGQRRLLMLCSREATQEEPPSRDRIRDQLLNQKLEGLANAYLEELRFAAVIRQP